MIKEYTNKNNHSKVGRKVDKKNVAKSIETYVRLKRLIDEKIINQAETEYNTIHTKPVHPSEPE